MAAVYQLLAHPGTGKYTIAKEIVRQLHERGDQAALLDNHATANLVWSLVPPGRRFEPDVMARMSELRSVLLDAIEELASPDLSLVFTNFLPPGRPPNILDRHRDVAVNHGRTLVAVVLDLDPAEVLRRVPDASRAERLKLVDVARAREQMADGMTEPEWPELTRLDINGMTAAQAAARLIAMADDTTSGR
jgi:hypothetical protein